MNPTVQAAIITGIVALVVCLINNHFQNKKWKAEQEERERKQKEEQAIRDAKLEMKLSSIEKKLDEHNGYADKIGSIEQNLAYIRGKMDKGVA